MCCKVLLELDDSLASLEVFSPLHYIKGGYAIEGLNSVWLMGLLVVGLLFLLLAAWRFNRRDLRLSGEGSWQVLGRLACERNNLGIMMIMKKAIKTKFSS